MTKTTMSVIATGTLLLAFAPSPVDGQATVHFTGRSNVLTGYVLAPPRQMIGFAATGIFTDLGGWGLMVDGKWTLDSPAGETVLAGRTPAQAEAEQDVFNLDRNAWTTLNLAAVRGMTPELAAYLGAGLSWKTSYFRYFDETRERGDLGFYWVENEAESRRHLNVHGGVFFRLGDRLAVQLGVQSAPLGVNGGVHLRLW